jgi:tagatose 1,6-diphosphate aldolase
MYARNVRVFVAPHSVARERRSARFEEPVMDQPFKFVDVPDLVEGDLTLRLAETGHKGPKNDRFAYYRFHMLQSQSGEQMGWITLRIGDPDGILRFPGHVGFTVYESFRGSRYAVRATRLLCRYVIGLRPPRG